MSAGLYAIVNQTDPRKLYVGSSKNLAQRQRQHWADLRHGHHSNSHLQRSWTKYGEDVFSFEVLMTCPVFELNRLEQMLLDFWRPHYNIATCAEAPARGAIRSGEVRRRISEAQIGRKASDETRRRMSVAQKGRTISVEHRRKLSMAQTGKTYTDAAKRKMSNSKKGDPRGPHTRWHVKRGMVNHACPLCPRLRV